MIHNIEVSDPRECPFLGDGGDSSSTCRLKKLLKIKYDSCSYDFDSYFPSNCPLLNGDSYKVNFKSLVSEATNDR